MSAAEQRQWSEQTPAGQLRTALRIPDAVDYDRAEQMTEEVRAHWRRTYGRELDQAEVSRVRAACEQRSVPVAVGDVPVSVPELVARMNASTITGDWRYIPEFRRGGGMAMHTGGRWEGDPVVVAQAEAADEARRLAAERDYESWRTGPAVMRTIGPAT